MYFDSNLKGICGVQNPAKIRAFVLKVLDSERDWAIEVVMPLGDELSSSQRIQVHALAGVEKMACVVHTGPFATIGEAYDVVAKWIDQNGYQIIGPARELNLRLPDTLGDQNDPNTVNEIQFPAEKAG